jgi:hypothetical protein
MPLLAALRSANGQDSGINHIIQLHKKVIVGVRRISLGFMKKIEGY